MNPQLLPATARDDIPAWQQTVVAFLSEKERRSGSRRTVEGYEEKSDAIHAVYERIVVEGSRFVGLRLTPAAYRHELGACAASGCCGAPDRCRTRDYNLQHAD